MPGTREASSERRGRRAPTPASVRRPTRALLAAGDAERVFDPASLQVRRGPCHVRTSTAEREARRTVVPDARTGVAERDPGE